MPKITKMKKLQTRIENEYFKDLEGIAVKRGESVSEVCRRFIKNGIANEAAEDGLDYTSMVIRESLRDILKPVEERLAKLNAKAAIHTGTAMYMSMQVLKDEGHDTTQLYKMARKKAAALLAEGDVDYHDD